MLVRFLVLFLVALSVEAAAPVISCTPSRTSGTEPLGVIFDCSGTTDADTSKPFHDLVYRTNFGDTNVGTDTWTNGANTNASKNFANGPIAAHVFESCVGSPFTVTHYVTDGTNVSQTTNTITVACADDTYTGSNTVCFTNGSDFTGCPSGATQTGSTSSWGTVMSCLGTTKRCLVKNDDTFTASATSNVSSVGPWTIGTYGSGAQPIVNLAATVKAIQLANTAVTDGRIMDINCVGTGAAGTDTCIGLTANASKMTILRVTSSNTGSSGFNLSSGTNSGITDSIVQDSTVSLNQSGVGIFARMWTSALLGNSSGPVGADEHAVRISRIQKSVIANNTARDPSATKSVMTIRVDPHVTTAEDSFYYVVSDNKLLSGTRSCSMFKIEPNSGDGRHYDAIVERNWVVAEACSGTSLDGITIDGVRITVRNNLVDLSATTATTRNGVTILQILGTEPVPDDVNAYNNTFYSSANGTTRGVRIDEAAVVNTIVKNNLCYFPGTGTRTCVSNAGTGTVTATNTGDIGTVSTDPLFDTPLTTPSGFRIGTSSYAATGGSTLYPSSSDDFLNCDDTTANEHIGALVPRARARCTSAAGP